MLIIKYFLNNLFFLFKITDFKYIFLKQYIHSYNYIHIYININIILVTMAIITLYPYDKIRNHV